MNMFERGKEAGIHFIVVANQDDVSTFESQYGNNLLKCKNYHILNKSDSEKRQTIISSEFANDCYKYINLGLSQKTSKEWSDDLIRELKAKIERDLQKEEKEREERRLREEREEEARRLQYEAEERARKENEVRVYFSWQRVFNDGSSVPHSTDSPITLDKDEYNSLLAGGPYAIANYIRSNLDSYGDDVSNVKMFRSSF